MGRKDLTQGPVAKSLINLSLPIVMANFLQTAYQLTDTFWVGRMGADAVAALSLSFPIIFLLISLGAGFAVSGTILVSQYAGQKNDAMVEKICLQTLFIILATSLTLAAAAYWAAPYLVGAMTDNQTVFDMTVSYLRISFVGLVFSYFYMMFQSLYRGVGDVKTPFVIVLVAVGLNFVIDPALVMGFGPIPALGVDGAAYATIGTQGIAALLALYFLSSGRGAIRLNFRSFRFDWKESKRIISLGIPASAEQSARALGMIVMTFLVAGFGKGVLAAYGVGVRVLSFVIMPSLGFSMATSALVGQNVGAGKTKRAQEVVHTALWIIFGFLTLAGALFYAYADQTLAIFVPGETEVIKEGAHFIRIIALTFGFIGIQQVSSGAMRGGGSPTISMLVAIVSLWVVRFPVAYILSSHTELEQAGVYWSFVANNLLGAGMALWIIKGGGWLKNVTGELSSAERMVIEETITESGIND